MKHYKKIEHSDAKNIPALKLILTGWIAALKDYNKVHDGKYPEFAWWYHERACIGFLAAAAWRSGGVALEEWVTNKGEKTAPRKGRSDLYVKKPQTYEFHIEAKRTWVSVTSKNAMQHLQKELARANVDCGQLQNPKRDERLAVLFVSPYFVPGKQENMRAQLSHWLEQFENEFSHCAIAWLFDGASLEPKKGQKAEKVHPGIVMLAARWKKA